MTITLMKARDVARRLGVGTERVRQFDDELKPTRTQSGQRVYNSDVVDQFAAARTAGEWARELTQPRPHPSRRRNELPPGLVRSGAVAKLLHATRARVRALDHELHPTFELNGRRLYNLEDVEKYVRERKP